MGQATEMTSTLRLVWSSLPAILPVIAMLAIWRRDALVPMLPALLFEAILLGAALLPEHFAVFPKGRGGQSDAWMIWLAVAVAVALAGHILWLWSKSFPPWHIVGCEALLLPAWFFIWWVIGSALEGPS